MITAEIVNRVIERLNADPEAGKGRDWVASIDMDKEAADIVEANALDASLFFLANGCPQGLFTVGFELGVRVARAEAQS